MDKFQPLHNLSFIIFGFNGGSLCMETQRKEDEQKNLFTIFSQGWVIPVKSRTINTITIVLALEPT